MSIFLTIYTDMERVVSVFPNTKLQLHTKRSWDFMGLTETLVRPYDGDVIIGMLDTCKDIIN